MLQDRYHLSILGIILGQFVALATNGLEAHADVCCVLVDDVCTEKISLNIVYGILLIAITIVSSFRRSCSRLVGLIG